jgi:hypothetical protein
MRAKTLNEVQNFERGQDPKDALNIGMWKELEEENQMKIPIEFFLENGGKLTQGREIWAMDLNIWPYGFYIKIDKEDNMIITQENLMTGFNTNFKKTMAISNLEDYAVKVPTKVIFK